PVRNSEVDVERRHHAVANTGITNRVENRVERLQWIAGKVHLRDEPREKAGADDREVNVRRTPGVVMIAPRVMSWLDRHEPIAALFVGKGPAGSREVRIQRRVMRVDFVCVAPTRIGLPDLDKGARQRTSVVVEDASFDDDPLADWSRGVLPREIVVNRPDNVVRI